MMKVRRIALLKPSISTKNKGDNIIVNYCEKILEGIFPFDFFCDVSTHNVIDELSRSIIDKSLHNILCGSGILTSDLFKGRMKGGQWMVDETSYYNNVILMGVGWERYQDYATKRTAQCYQKFLSKKYLHAVRDNYSLGKLAECGIKNVINTGCPTIWGMTPEAVSNIRKNIAKKAAIAFNYHQTDEKRDKVILNTAREFYGENIFLWAQSQRDIDYAEHIGLKYNPIRTITHLSQYEIMLEFDEIDYIGCRLHGGIHALNYCQRAFIVPVDNRSAEMGEDFKLPVFNAGDIKQVLPYYVPEIKIDLEAINEWKGQFKCT